MKIGVKNFRVFKNLVEFDIKPLTIFTGPNGSGKSTLSTLIGFLGKVFKIEVFNEKLFIAEIEYLNLSAKDIQSFGTFKENLSKGSNSNIIDIYYSIGEMKFHLSYLIQDKLNRYDKEDAELIEIEITEGERKYLHLNKVKPDEYFLNDEMLIFTKFSMGASERPLSSITSKKTLNKRSRYRVWVSKNDSAEYLRDALHDNLAVKVENNLELKVEFGEDGYKSLFGDDNYFESKTPFLIKNPELFLSSEFGNQVLSSPGIFEDKKSVNEHILSKLEDVGISNRIAFIKAYIEFEARFVERLYLWYFNNISSPRELTIDELKSEFTHEVKYLLWGEPDCPYNKEGKVKDKEKEEFYSRVEEKNGRWGLPRFSTYQVLGMGLKLEEILDSTNTSLSTQDVLGLIEGIDNPLVEFFILELQGCVLKEDGKSKVLFSNCFDLSKIKEVLAGIIGFENNKVSLFKESFGQYIGGYDEVYDFVDSVPNILLYSEMKRYPFYFSFLSKKSCVSESEENHVDFRVNKVSRWLKEFGVGGRLVIRDILDGKEKIGFSLWVDRNSVLFPLKNESRGIKKLIAILLYLTSDRINLRLEEPEANLHPAFQSKLMEVVIDSLKEEYRPNKKNIIETHSEYFIRKIQYLIASKDSDVTVDDVSIYYLHHPDNVPEGEKQVYKLDIREDGFMNNDFGKGFFDEASNLSIALLNQSGLN